MKTTDDAIALAREMVAIGEHVGRTTTALITNMDRPLGQCVGNALEVQEAACTLQGNGPDDLVAVCIELAANMLELAGKGSVEECRAMVQEQLSNGEALQKFAQMVKAQGGDEHYVLAPECFGHDTCSVELKASCDGWIHHMNTKDDLIDPLAGIVLAKKTGEKVQKGEVLATLYAQNGAKLTEGKNELSGAYTIGSEKPVHEPLIYARITRSGVEKLV